MQVDKKKVAQAFRDAFAESGDSIAQVIEFHLKNAYGIDPEDILEEPEKVSKAISDIYGAYAGQVESRLCFYLSEYLNLGYDGNSLKKLVKYIERKQTFESVK